MARRDQTKGFAGQVAAQEKALKQFGRLALWERQMDLGREDDLDVMYIKLRPPRYDGDEWFVVLNAEEGDVKYVAFHSADDMIGALVGVANRMLNNTMKFKKEKPYEGN